MPEMHYVDSSNLEAVGYNEETQELHIQFISGGYYIYTGVPSFIFEDLMNATSKGSYLNREIKPVYQYVRQ